jgi:hypothetical protein
MFEDLGSKSPTTRLAPERPSFNMSLAAAANGEEAEPAADRHHADAAGFIEGEPKDR